MTKIVSIVNDLRATFTNEDQLQAALAAALEAGLPSYSVEREAQLADRRSRIDLFLCNENASHCVGIEVKIKGTVGATRRQLERYARDATLDELILVSTRALHAHMPTEMNGKPVTTILMLEAGL